MSKTLAPPEARKRLKQLDKRHGDYQDTIIADFEVRLDEIISKATEAVTADLAGDMVLDDGLISGTIRNRGYLRDVDSMFREAMKEAGYDRLTLAFVNQFPEQLPLLTDTLRTISDSYGINFAAGKILSPSDLKDLANQQRLTLESLRTTVQEVGKLAKERSLAKFNGLRPAQLERLLEKTFDLTSGKAKTLAATGMATWYRQATARAFNKIEAEEQMRYTYDGPEDVLNRPFCRALKLAMDNGRTWTRGEIDAMNNGQLPNVMESGGGYNCRHQWRIALDTDSIAHFRIHTNLAAGGLLKPNEVTAFTRNSVIKGTYLHKTATDAAADKLRSTGVDFNYAPPAAPFGAGFYASTLPSDRARGVEVAFSLQRPLAGTWEEVKAAIAQLGVEDESPKVRAQEIRRALTRKGYDGVIATRKNGERLILALKKGSVAMLEPKAAE